MIFGSKTDNSTEDKLYHLQNGQYNDHPQKRTGYWKCVWEGGREGISTRLTNWRTQEKNELKVTGNGAGTTGCGWWGADG